MVEVRGFPVVERLSTELLSDEGLKELLWASLLGRGAPFAPLLVLALLALIEFATVKTPGIPKSDVDGFGAEDTEEFSLDLF